MKMEPFKFPDPDAQPEMIEEETIEAVQAEEEPEVEEKIEVEAYDDTPEEDRGRVPAEPPEEVTEEELANYSQRAKKRLKHFTKSYHDERRAKEEALRDKQAAEEMARVTRYELEQIRKQLAETSKVAQAASSEKLQAEYAAAKKAYREAYEAGDTDALEAANEAMIDLKMRMAAPQPAVQQAQPPQKPLQREQEGYNQPQNAQKPQHQAPASQIDQKVLDWQSENPWFNSDRLMTQFALGLHQQLIDQKVDPNSNAYYEAINKRVRQAFPDYDWDDAEDTSEAVETQPEARAKKPVNIVASAQRSTRTKKVPLSGRQMALAKRLGISNEEYAAQLVKYNGGRA